jgi:hypothetical protein
MLNTYIKNRGLTQTIIHENNRNQFNEINWDADYDGNNANISVTSNTDGNKQHFDVTLDNDDLANILNIPSVNIPLDKRLQMDFEKHSDTIQPQINPYHHHHKVVSLDNVDEPVFQSPKNASYLSSPLPNEELIVPITIDEKTIDKYTFTPKRRHRHKKDHKTYKVYKKVKSSKSKNTVNKSKNKSSKSSKRFTLF